MQIRPGVRLVYQIGRVVVQTSALFLDLDDLTGGRLSRMFAPARRPRRPSPPPAVDRRGRQVYGSSRGMPLHQKRKPLRRR